MCLSRAAQELEPSARLPTMFACRGLPLDWVPLDEDLLSLELPSAFKARPQWDADAACLPACLLVEGGVLQGTALGPPLEGPLTCAALPCCAPHPLHTSPQELAIDRDRSSLFYVARALHGLQQQWGAIPHIKASAAPGS